MKNNMVLCKISKNMTHGKQCYHTISFLIEGRSNYADISRLFLILEKENHHHPPDHYHLVMITITLTILMITIITLTILMITITIITILMITIMDRFCLGLLSNINRNTVVEQTRRHIGKVRSSLWSHWVSEGLVFLEQAV